MRNLNIAGLTQNYIDKNHSFYYVDLSENLAKRHLFYNYDGKILPNLYSS